MTREQRTYVMAVIWAAGIVFLVLGPAGLAVWGAVIALLALLLWVVSS